MRVFQSTVVCLLVLSSFPISAQVYPVLHDADDKPIGYVVSIESTPYGTRYVHLVSKQGYLATMNYERGLQPPDTFELIGSPAVAFYESDDCTGNPVLVPWQMVSATSTLLESYDPSLDGVVRAFTRDHHGDQRAFQAGDIINYLKIVYSIPPEASGPTIYAKSYSHSPPELDSPEPGACVEMDRCDAFDRSRWPHITQFLTTGMPPEEYCPDIQDASQPHFRVRGFRLSALQVNDPLVTGYKSESYRLPYTIKFMDIETILSDGFEPPP